MTYTNLPLDKFYQVVSDTTNEVIFGGYVWIEVAMHVVRSEEPVSIFCDGVLTETYDPSKGWGSDIEQALAS